MKRTSNPPTFKQLRRLGKRLDYRVIKGTNKRDPYRYYVLTPYFLPMHLETHFYRSTCANNLFEIHCHLINSHPNAWPNNP